MSQNVGLKTKVNQIIQKILDERAEDCQAKWDLVEDLFLADIETALRTGNPYLVWPTTHTVRVYVERKKKRDEFVDVFWTLQFKDFVEKLLCKNNFINYGYQNISGFLNSCLKFSSLKLEQLK